MKLNIQRFADGSVSIEVGLDTKSFDAQISKLEYDLEELEETYKLALKDPDFGEENILKLQKDIETTKNKIIGLQKQQLALNKTTKEYSNSFGNVTSKLTKMGLAIFGIRSAYMLIRQSMSQIAQDNDALANKLNTIKNALATAIAPVAEWLINIVYKLLAYLNVITKTFLGIDLFAKTSKGAKATAGSLKSASGSAKELKKQLAGFDEMNVLSDTSSKSGGGGGGGGAITQPKEITPEPPDTSAWEKKIKEIKDQWSQLNSMSRKEIASYIRQTDSVWDTFGLGLFDWIQGVAKVLEGLGKTFKGVFEFIKGIALGDTELINQGIRNIMLGLKEFFEGLIQTSWAWIEIQLGILKGIVKSWFKFFGELISSYIDVMLTLPRTFVQTVKDLFNNAKTFFKNIYDAVKKLLTGDFKGALESFKKAFKSVFDSLWTIAKAPINLIINGINALIRE